MRELGYNDKEVSIIVEKLFVHNEFRFAQKNGNYINYNEKNKFIELMSVGGEKFESPFVEDEEKLDNFVNSILGLIVNYNEQINQFNLTMILPSVGRELKTNDELEYVLVNLLNKIRDSLDENINLLKDPDFIMNFEIKTDIAIDCYGLIEKYNLVRDYLDNIFYPEVNNVANNEENFKIEEATLNSSEQFLYLCKTSGESYFISDIKDMKK